ncbi:coenzyme PQQ synthesis protein D [Caenibius tardaugens NBRC 16725]|uniref:PqqA binding protein n=1 Tax=Caenibius tardaugens NBRC 16725 TaxID=1219035 RepID=U2YMQ2_9SPHN|nr:pyrroloquinoline quinone biosynthesis peptide chaperone PqqD [Caenibius tardaugens]AZI37682.1 pyrroloquinoline quinone biosynthesis peptide chaperone PqqD [Caenibius tardaugens NBRC 16725]GAD49772.1 coenzyme PQQ synthesis protein D [Caenibius tardaugens NBRC 16725]
MIVEDAVPRLGAGVKFRFDKVRDAWVLLAPERLFQPDEIAVEILKLVDGARTIASIADTLASRFEAPRELILTDVVTLLQDLADKGVIRL